MYDLIFLLEKILSIFSLKLSGKFSFLFSKFSFSLKTFLKTALTSLCFLNFLLKSTHSLTIANFGFL